VHLGGIVAGRDLDQGVLDIQFNNEGMTVAGQAALAMIPAKLDVVLDFRTGPPSQVLQTVNVAGRPTAAQLTSVGLNPGGVVTGGAADVRATLTERRDGQGQLAVSADLADAALRLDLANWTKPVGTAAQADAVVRLSHDRLVGIDSDPPDRTRRRGPGQRCVRRRQGHNTADQSVEAGGHLGKGVGVVSRLRRRPNRRHGQRERH
jgi:hypothetical protein